jgi:hypothetical protein
MKEELKEEQAINAEKEKSPKKKNIPESEEAPQEKINLFTLVEKRKLGWNVKARLEYMVEAKKIPAENTELEWDKILKGI